MKKIILLSGKMGSGKNTFATMLKEYFEKKNQSVSMDLLAKNVKDGAMQDFKKLYEHINGQMEKCIEEINHLSKGVLKPFKAIKILDTLITTKDNFHEEKTPISRIMLQLYGTDIFRNRISQNYWINDTISRIDSTKFQNTLITDLRFVNEIEVMKEKLKKFKNNCDKN